MADCLAQLDCDPLLDSGTRWSHGAFGGAPSKVGFTITDQHHWHYHHYGHDYQAAGGNRFAQIFSSWSLWNPWTHCLPWSHGDRKT